jgi:hypothetical protein
MTKPSKRAKQKPAAKTAQPEITDADLAQVSGGKDAKPRQDMTNNLATTAQKAAEKNDAYIRS